VKQVVMLGNDYSIIHPDAVLPYTPPKGFPDDFCLTFRNGVGWTVTHIPTGLQVTRQAMSTERLARKVASSRLRKYGVAKFREQVKRKVIHMERAMGDQP
jgi:hypothetical protein